MGYNSRSPSFRRIFLSLSSLTTPTTMASSLARALTAIGIAFASYASASVTIYTATGTAAGATSTQCIGAVPCDGSVLTAVGLQQNMSTTVPVQLFSGGMDGLSIRQNGYFAGFSLELSVINHLRSFSFYCSSFMHLSKYSLQLAMTGTLSTQFL